MRQKPIGSAAQVKRDKFRAKLTTRMAIEFDAALDSTCVWYAQMFVALGISIAQYPDHVRISDLEMKLRKLGVNVSPSLGGGR